MKQLADLGGNFHVRSTGRRTTALLKQSARRRATSALTVRYDLIRTVVWRTLLEDDPVVPSDRV